MEIQVGGRLWASEDKHVRYCDCTYWLRSYPNAMIAAHTRFVFSQIISEQPGLKYLRTELALRSVGSRVP